MPISSSAASSKAEHQRSSVDFRITRACILAALLRVSTMFELLNGPAVLMLLWLFLATGPPEHVIALDSRSAPR